MSTVVLLGHEKIVNLVAVFFILAHINQITPARDRKAELKEQVHRVASLFTIFLQTRCRIRQTDDHGSRRSYICMTSRIKGQQTKVENEDNLLSAPCEQRQKDSTNFMKRHMDYTVQTVAPIRP